MDSDSTRMNKNHGCLTPPKNDQSLNRLLKLTTQRLAITQVSIKKMIEKPVREKSIVV
ncbi:hypothetical protein MITS9504_01689 [Synechococcus sp. MIT S9504]|nr:hypothetical protein MITS9504_01689 [Synechococcus sp. MIT S9504]